MDKNTKNSDDKLQDNPIFKVKKPFLYYQAPQLIKLEDTQPETGGTSVPEGSAGNGLLS
ncbi:MAG: hypothetical protein K0U37_02235 [Gammaproteobacteria bacterium]|nr:hypothetical protein [Gammaproteobacteria bacterium]